MAHSKKPKPVSTVPDDAQSEREEFMAQDNCAASSTVRENGDEWTIFCLRRIGHTDKHWNPSKEWK